ncbi:hypothetical protein M9H77_00934 [Catharanthus roseus]|uniref:Uncharacterized protein n=1 Tax=Catharanthus roseus TaxID=4058 RepID=A0ACC0C4D9_CATRO|nr:hypothetical protein M9H77_00934 [Catharanthus roseus]
MDSTTGRDSAATISDNHRGVVEDDDAPMLSSQAMAALREFLSEQNRATANEGSTAAEDNSEEVALVTEDWRLSQFWYDRETAETVAKEVLTLCQSLDNPSVACIACPTLYAYLKKFDSGVPALLLEYDERFEQYGTEFTFYDYNQPEDLPLSMKHSYSVIVADPPYLSKECLEKVGKTISFLSRPEKSYLLLLTGAYEPSFEYFTATRWCRFLHITCRDLIGGFSCYSLISSIAINNKKIRYNGLAWFLIGEVKWLSSFHMPRKTSCKNTGSFDVTNNLVSSLLKLLKMLGWVIASICSGSTRLTRTAINGSWFLKLKKFLKAGLPTRVGQWWEGIPFLTSSVVIVCGVIYLVCLLVGYDSFAEVCFLPSAVISRFQVYRIYTSVLFHGSLLHVLFNMMALVPLGSELERIMGSVRLLFLTILLATSNAVIHLLVALLVAYNPFRPYEYFMNECGIGFSGILFSMIVIETSLSGVQSRSVFGLFNVPAQWYAWILLIVFQLIMTNVSLLGHLCGILSGYAYIYGLFNVLIPGTSFFSTIESSSWLLVFEALFLHLAQEFGKLNLGTHFLAVNTCSETKIYIVHRWEHYGLHSHSFKSKSPSKVGLSILPISELWIAFWKFLEEHLFTDATKGNFFSSSGLDGDEEDGSLLDWNVKLELSTQDSRFPGRGRTLASSLGQTVSGESPDSSLQVRLLENNNTTDHPSQPGTNASIQPMSDRRQPRVDSTAAAVNRVQNPQGFAASDEDIQKLVAMGFEKTQVEVALAAADGDLNVAVEILSQQVCIVCHKHHLVHFLVLIADITNWLSNFTSSFALGYPLCFFNIPVFVHTD